MILSSIQDMQAFLTRLAAELGYTVDAPFSTWLKACKT